MPSIPLGFSHVGVTVPDVDAALAWYRDVLGYTLLGGPLEVIEDDSPLGKAAANSDGEGFTWFQFAHMASIDGIGLELFQFDSPASRRRDDNFEFWLGGIDHLALATPNVGVLAALIAANGGRQRSDVIVTDASKGHEIVHCEDPWGTVIELCSHLYSTMWAS